MMLSLSEHIPDDSPVRVIDAFIDSADLEQLGFHSKGHSKEGRPAYPIAILAKLYIYGYLNGLRSSRKLEQACKVNIELWWLLSNQKPHYKTIANFRKDNPDGFSNLFVYFRKFCLGNNLYGKSVIAIDGSKFRGQNSMKNNYNQRKITKQLEYLDQQYQDYAKALDNNDKHDSDGKIKQHLDKRKNKYENLSQQLEQTDETQISTTDPDARALPLHMRIVQVGYNLQSTVDNKHNLIVDYQVTNKNDHRALATMAIRAKQALELNNQNSITVLADKGYHTGEQLQQCHDNNINTLVAVPRTVRRTDTSKPDHLRKENFKYNPKSNTYTCPQGHTLEHQSRYTRKRKGLVTGAQFDRYKIDIDTCKQCPHFSQCVSKGNKSRKQGRYIDRYLTDKAVESNKKNVKENRSLYKARQAIVEHPFGTIKRQWGYSYTLMKSLPKVQTEFSIITLCYNLRRAMSILGTTELKKALKSLLNLIYRLTDSVTHISKEGNRILHNPSQCFTCLN